MSRIEIRPIGAENRAAVDALTARLWAGTLVVYVPDGAIESSRLPGAVALAGDDLVGAVTWRPAGDALRVVTIASIEQSIGIGRALLAAAEAEARRQGLGRLLVSTTNDNTRALRFYQRAGFSIAALHPNAIAGLRVLKPAIPEAGEDGIPIRDQIDLEKPVG